jgi:PKD repeat protein
MMELGRSHRTRAIFKLPAAVLFCLALACGGGEPEQTPISDEVAERPVLDQDPPIQADFDVSARCGVSPLVVTFENRSVGEIESYQWDFDDGTISTLRNPPPHEYSHIRTYRVRLTVKSKKESSTREMPVQIVEPMSPPVDLVVREREDTEADCGTPTDPAIYDLSWSRVTNATRYRVVIYAHHERGAAHCADTLYTQIINTESTVAQITRCPECGSNMWSWSVHAGNLHCGGIWSEPAEAPLTPEELPLDVQVDNLVRAYGELGREIQLVIARQAWSELPEWSTEAQALIEEFSGFLGRYGAREELSRRHRESLAWMKEQLEDFVSTSGSFLGPTSFQLVVVKNSEKDLSVLDSEDRPLLTRVQGSADALNWVAMTGEEKYYLNWMSGSTLRVFTKTGMSQSLQCTLTGLYGILGIATTNCPGVNDAMELRLQNRGKWEPVLKLLELEGIFQ